MPRITNIPERFAVEQLCRTGAVFPPAGSGMKPGPQLAEALAEARRRTLTGETAEEAVQKVLRKRK